MKVFKFLLALQKEPESLFTAIKNIREFFENNFENLSANECENLTVLISDLEKYRRERIFIEEIYGDSSDDFFGIYEQKKIECIKVIELLTNSIRKCFKERHTDRISLKKGFLNNDITDMINLTLDEIVISRNNECNLASIVLCGKVIETALVDLYKKEAGEDADEKKLGINAIVNRLKKKYAFNDSIIDQINIIAKHRNKSVHGGIVVPTNDEADGVLLLTKDMLQKITSAS